MKLLKQATYIRYVLAKLSKFVQISTLTFPESFSEESLKIKKDLKLVSRSQFSDNFLIKKFSFVILHKLAKFNYHTVFTSQVIQ